MDKGLEIPEVFLKKSLEVKPYNRSGTFVMAFMLNLFGIDGDTEV